MHLKRRFVVFEKMLTRAVIFHIETDLNLSEMWNSRMCC